MKWITPARVHRAMTAMHAWWLSAQNQGGKHLMPLLAALEKKAAHGPVVFEEKDDRDFWNRYFKVPGNDEKPYAVPLTLLRGEVDFPHSNASTIRKNRWDRWGFATHAKDAADNTTLTLDVAYAAKFREKALVKSGKFHPVPVVDLAALLLRDEVFPDDATARTLEEQFRNRFPQTAADYETIFRFRDEPVDGLFTDVAPSEADFSEQIALALTDTPRPEGTRIALAIDDDDAVWVQVRELLALGSSGVILRGVPGTGKTYYARQIAAKLTSEDLVYRAQFHPSYGYEDFVEGYRPLQGKSAGFEIVPKAFLLACTKATASENAGKKVVFILDEINRGDPSRIFGELLTYLERDYRDETFQLPYSGSKGRIPSNLIVIGTMNPYDRSIAQLDAAFVRRFDHIDIRPDSEVVGAFLDANGFSADQVTIVRGWFDNLQGILPSGIGHAYFKDVRRAEDLRLVWQYRMLPVCEAALELDPSKLDNAKKSFDAAFSRLLNASTTGSAEVVAPVDA